jgi:NhaP-type Na+/H+ and K+/H+ antiporter
MLARNYFITLEQTMTTLTLDDELINQVIAKSPYKNAQEAVINILFDYVQRNKEQTFFEQLCLDNKSADDDLALLFERDKDTGRDIEL